MPEKMDTAPESAWPTPHRIVAQHEVPALDRNLPDPVVLLSPWELAIATVVIAPR